MSRNPELNTALTQWNGPLGLPDFTAFSDADFASVFDAALAADLAEVEAIANNPQAPTINNTLKALQLTGKALDHVSSIFWLRAGAHTNETIQTLERDIAPKMSRHYSRIMMNPALFARIDALYEQRDALNVDAETRRVLEKTWKGFVRSGAKLDEAGKQELAEINEKLASLGARFGQNVLKDEASWALFITDEALKKFRASKGWEAGVDAEVTMIAAGADVTVETLRSQSPVVGFVIDQKGLMGGVSVKGAKFSKIQPK